MRKASTPSGATSFGFLRRVWLELRVAILRHQKGERRQIGVGWGIGEAPDALWERRPELTCRETGSRVGASSGSTPKSAPRNPAARAGQDLERPGAGPKAAMLGERGAVIADRAAFTLLKRLRR